MPYKDVNREYCRQMHAHLSGAFIWASAPEGSIFWDRLSDRLYELATGNNPTLPFYANLRLSGPDLQKQIDKLEAEKRQLGEQVNSQALEIVRLRKSLLIADFANMAGARAKGGMT